MPECAVCWLARTEAERDQARAELAQAQAANAEMAGRLAKVTEVLSFIANNRNAPSNPSGDIYWYSEQCEIKARAALDAAKGEAK